MKFLAFSDFHAHNHQYAATLTEHRGVLLNSRLVDSVNVLDEITAYAERNNIPAIVFGGDLFHKRTSLQTDVLWAITGALERMGATAEVHLLVGNHDQGDRSGAFNSLTAFAHIPGVHVYSSYGKVRIDGVDFHFLPFTESTEEYLSWAANVKPEDVLVGHASIKGGTVGSDFVLETDHDIDPDSILKPRLALFGHYHEHQILWPKSLKSGSKYAVSEPVGLYIGASHEHNWGDSGGRRGFLDITLEEDAISISRIETSAPKFVKDPTKSTSSDFLKVKGSIPEGTECAHSEVVPDDPEARVEISIQGLDEDEILAEWLEQKTVDNKEELLTLGRDILNTIKGKQ